MYQSHMALNVSMNLTECSINARSFKNCQRSTQNILINICQIIDLQSLHSQTFFLQCFFFLGDQFFFHKNIKSFIGVEEKEFKEFLLSVYFLQLLYDFRVADFRSTILTLTNVGNEANQDSANSDRTRTSWLKKK